MTFRISLTIFLVQITCFYSKGQNESRLEQALVGKVVEVLIEMPATSKGLEIYPESTHKSLNNRTKRIDYSGVALYPHDRVRITKIKQKRKHIEFQLAGGGSSWSGDSPVAPETIAKSERHLQVEKVLTSTLFPDSTIQITQDRKALEYELKDLEYERAKAQRKSEQVAAIKTQVRNSENSVRRNQAGSRFNIRYDHKVRARELTASSVMKALQTYINFNPTLTELYMQNSFLRPMEIPLIFNLPELELVSKGMSIEEVIEKMGFPNNNSDEIIGGLKKTTCTFENSEYRIDAVFVEKVLVKYWIQPK